MPINPDLLKGLKALFAVAKTDPSAFNELEDVADQWSEADGEHKTITREEIKTGPSESASGDGAFKMVREYSNPAEQSQAVKLYEEISKWLEGVGATQKAQAKQISAIAEVLVASAAPAVKSEVEETFLSKAEGRLSIAQKALRKAEMADDEDEDEKEEKAEHMEKAERALVIAAKLLAKAEAENEDKMDDEVEEKCSKAMSTLKKLKKSLAKTKATMKAEDEKEEAKKTESAHEKEGEAEKEAMKQHEKEKVEKADSDQLKLVNARIDEVLNLVSGISKSSPVPEFVKSLHTESLAERVSTAIENEDFSMSEAMSAQNLLSRTEAARRGQYDGTRLQDEIANAPERVRNLFKVAA
ncbi:MAG: hypothetical protein KGI54_14500 [Pseudomonadota bacterium]|nr:hypothetical protein [Pseudomonadota bacterium]